MLQGHQSWVFDKKPAIVATATVVGPDEGKGPLANDFDIVHEDTLLGQKSWEHAERSLMEEAVKLVMENAGITGGQVQMYVGGDLMNQIISSTFAARTLAVPYLGVFGACSTSMESLALAALIVNSGSARQVIAGTCSHNCTAEKQFRYPTEYGAQKPPTAQFTVTGAGAAVIALRENDGPVITSATIGRIVDMGIKDPMNMGAAMAPAAVDTIEAHFRDLGTNPSDYDMIVTGDLATVGHSIANELFHEHVIAIGETTFKDCGLMVYDVDVQPVMAGGSGCACSAVVTYGHLVKQLRRGALKKVLVVATGALLSPLSFQQGDSIPCIAHAVCLESGVN